MATLNSAIEALVNNLHAKMTSNDPLTAEEQTLIASAIDKLSTHTTWEQAIVAVAEEHLNTATQNMSQTLTSATAALTSAQSDITVAKDEIQTQNANLAIIPQIKSDVETSLNGFAESSNTAITSNLAGMARPVFGMNSIEAPSSSGNNQRSQAVFAVYDASGDTWVARPSFATSTNSLEQLRLEYMKLLADGSGKSVLTTHFVNSGTFYATPTDQIYRYGSSAILPLATKADSNDIEYDVVYSTQDSAASGTANYQGVYCRSGGNVTITKPKLNVDATDKWAISTATDQTWNNVAVLYDNTKHCVVMVEESSSLLIEKYRDGNITTNISVADSAALQSYVDNGDFTVVKLITHVLAWPYCQRKYDGAEAISNNSHYYDCHGFFGKSGSAIKMGGEKYNAHYRFTQDKKLEPVNYHFTSSVNTNRYHGSYGVDASKADLRVSITDMQGNTLGIYHYQSKGNGFGQHAGYVAMALMCMNPYSHVGILNDHTVYYSTSPYYGHGRICKSF